MKTEAKSKKNERDIRRIIILGTSIAFGCVLGSLEALRPSRTGYSFEITLRTFVAFLVGAALVFPFWHIIFRAARTPHQKSSRRWAMVFLVLFGIGAFLYPLRFMPTEKLSALLIGLTASVVALSGVAGLLLMVKRFVDQDEKQNTIKK
jgi:hypothetical protein